MCIEEMLMRILTRLIAAAAPLALIMTPLAAWAGAAATPIPEPNIYILLAVGGIAVLLFSRSGNK